MKVDYNYVNALSTRDTDINEHLLGMYGVAVGLNAQVIVEIGAGQSSYALTAVANKTGGRLWSIDKSIKAHLRLFPEGEEVLENERRITFLVGDDMEIVNTWDKEIDFLLIDGNHLYEHVKRELNIWPSKVRKGGVIAMHDTGYDIDCGARQALDEWIGKAKHPVIHLQDSKKIGMSYICVV